MLDFLQGHSLFLVYYLLIELLNFLSLRADSHAQYEIREYADVMMNSVKKWVPVTYDAFMDYRVGGTEVSAKGKIIIQKLINCLLYTSPSPRD